MAMSRETNAELTLGLWGGAIKCTEEINKSFSDTANSCGNDSTCAIICCLQPEFPIFFCASWLVCCITPTVVATALTPATGLVDCCMFSGRAIAKVCNQNSGPVHQRMDL